MFWFRSVFLVLQTTFLHSHYCSSSLNGSQGRIRLLLTSLCFVAKTAGIGLLLSGCPLCSGPSSQLHYLVYFGVYWTTKYNRAVHFLGNSIASWLASLVLLLEAYTCCAAKRKRGGGWSCPSSAVCMGPRESGLGLLWQLNTHLIWLLYYGQLLDVLNFYFMHLF